MLSLVFQRPEPLGAEASFTGYTLKPLNVLRSIRQPLYGIVEGHRQRPAITDPHRTRAVPCVQPAGAVVARVTDIVVGVDEPP
jgi:hypothetical protein